MHKQTNLLRKDHISSKRAVVPERNYAEIGLANSLHASAKFRQYNERYDLIYNLSRLVVFTI